MDWQTILTLAVSVGLPALTGWVAGIHKDITELRVNVAEKYVRHEHLGEIKEALVRIEALLHTKADKRPRGEV